MPVAHMLRVKAIPVTSKHVSYLSTVHVILGRGEGRFPRRFPIAALIRQEPSRPPIKAIGCFITIVVEFRGMNRFSRNTLLISKLEVLEVSEFGRVRCTMTKLGDKALRG